jgi:hypothetical protein
MVSSQILGREQGLQRTKLIKHFIEVASECLLQGNFFALFSICNGLDLTPVYRLEVCATFPR